MCPRAAMHGLASVWLTLSAAGAALPSPCCFRFLGPPPAFCDALRSVDMLTICTSYCRRMHSKVRSFTHPAA